MTLSTHKFSYYLSNIYSIRFEWMLCMMMAGIIIALAIFFKLDFPRLAFGNLQHIYLEGEYIHLDRQELENIIVPAIGQNLLDLDLDIFEKKFSHIPWVKSVFIQRIWPNKLNVYIEERKPIARWNNKGLLDQSGIVFFPQVYNYPELPLFVVAQNRSQSALLFYYYLKEIFEKLDDEIVYLSEDPSYSWEMRLASGYIIKLGRNDLEKRIQRFVSSYHAGFGQVIDKAQCIDLRYPDGFAVGWNIQKKVVRC